MKKAEHREFFEGVQKRYPQEFNNCRSFVLNHLRGKGTTEYILSQQIVGDLIAVGISLRLAYIFGKERFHQFLGMLIYDTIMIDLKDADFKDWIYEKTELQKRDYLQTIYFKGKKKVSC